MAVRRPLVVLDDGNVGQLPAGDTVAGAGSSSIITGTVTLDFGSNGSLVISSNTTVSGISSANKVVVSTSREMPNNTTYADEFEFAKIMVVGDVPASNTLRITAYATEKVFGQRLFNYIII